MFDLTRPICQDVDKAPQHLETIQWPNGAECPDFGNYDQKTVTELV